MWIDIAALPQPRSSVRVPGFSRAQASVRSSVAGESGLQKPIAS